MQTYDVDVSHMMLKFMSPFNKTETPPFRNIRSTCNVMSIQSRKNVLLCDSLSRKSNDIGYCSIGIAKSIAITSPLQ